MIEQCPYCPTKTFMNPDGICLRCGNQHRILTISMNIHAPVKEGDVGYNLFSNQETVVRMNEVCLVHTGVKIKLPPDTWGLITARSSTVFKLGIMVMQGVIDNGYTGELMIPCTAIEKQRILPSNTAIAQLILFPIITPKLEFVSKLPETQRGETGFGSTDVVVIPIDVETEDKLQVE